MKTRTTLLTIILTLVGTLSGGSAWSDIVYYGTTLQPYYVRFDDANNTAVNLTEGSTLKLTRYVASDSAIQTAGLAAGSYSATIRAGTAGTQASGDAIVATIPSFRWSGSVELPADADVLRLSGDSTAAGQLAEAFDNDGTGGDMDLSSLSVTGSTTFTGNVALADGLTVTRSSNNLSAITATGNGTGSGASLSSGTGAFGSGLLARSLSTNGAGAEMYGIGNAPGIYAGGGNTGSGMQIVAGATGNALEITATNGHGINSTAAGSSKHGIVATGGNAGTSDGIRGVAGTGGVGMRLDSQTTTGNTTFTGTTTHTGLVTNTAGLTSNITGNLSGSVGSVGSVTAGVTLANAAITAGKFDGSTAFPVTQADAGATAIARTGADGDTLETLSDQVDGVATNATTAAAQSTTAATQATTAATQSTTAATQSATAAANTTTILNRLGTWTGTGRNTLLGAVQAMFRKDADATVPSDVNANLGGGTGTANNSTDSLEAQRDNIDAIFDGAPTFAAAMDEHEYTSARALKLDNLDMPVSDLRPSVLVSTTIDGTPSSNTTLVLADGPPDDDALNGALVVVTDSVDDTQKAVGLVKDYDESTKTVTLVADPGIFMFADEDKVDVIAGGPAVPLWLSGP